LTISGGGERWGEIRVDEGGLEAENRMAEQNGKGWKRRKGAGGGAVDNQLVKLKRRNDWTKQEGGNAKRRTSKSRGKGVMGHRHMWMKLSKSIKTTGKKV